MLKEVQKEVIVEFTIHDVKCNLADGGTDRNHGY